MLAFASEAFEELLVWSGQSDLVGFHPPEDSVTLLHCRDTKEEESENHEIKKGSDVEKIRDIIVHAGKPLHLNEILEGLGRTDEADAKSKITGLLGWYIGKKRVFTRPSPNTYDVIRDKTVPDEDDLPPWERDSPKNVEGDAVDF